MILVDGRNHIQIIFFILIIILQYIFVQNVYYKISIISPSILIISVRGLDAEPLLKKLIGLINTEIEIIVKQFMEPS